MPASTQCPICKRDLPARDGASARGPFCSARCRSIDLGNWLDGQYRIGTTMDEVEDELSPAIDPKDAPH
jgi:hypothetical protein